MRTATAGRTAVTAGGLDDAAFTELVHRHADVLWRFAMVRLRDAHDAEDAVQETFLRAHRSLDTWRGEASIRTWLHSICRNVCIDRMRARRPVVSLDEVGVDPGVADDAAAVVRRAALTQAVARLSDEEREAFHLVDALGFSGEEAAAICGVPATTLRSRLHRAHRKLIVELQRGEQ